MEETCHFVSSRGLMKSCTRYQRVIRSSNPYIQEDILSGVNEGDTVYVCSTAIPMFSQKMLPRLMTRIILVTGDADEAPPYHIPSCVAIINSPFIVRWFAQNCLLHHPKVVHLPIGLDYHTMAAGASSWGPQQSPQEQESDIQRIMGMARPDRKIKCYATFHFALGRGDRQEAFDHVPATLVDYEPTPTTRRETHLKQIEYAFVLSPFGRGPDCHRTWEALVLGCIPIIKTSQMDPLFEDLPVLLVKQWSDVTQELLESTYIAFKKRSFSDEKLTLNYWRQRLKAASVSI